MTPNVSYALLDAVVIAGHGEDPVVEWVDERGGRRTWSHARLLEEAAALGGVLRHLGVGKGVPCVLDLGTDLDAVVAALATARIGGMVTTTDDAAAPAVVVSAGSAVPSGDRVRLVRGAPGESVQEPDLDWVVMIRAGRTDPAACEVLDPRASYSQERSVAEQIAVLEDSAAPYDAADLRRLLQA